MSDIERRGLALMAYPRKMRDSRIPGVAIPFSGRGYMTRSYADRYA